MNKYKWLQWILPLFSIGIWIGLTAQSSNEVSEVTSTYLIKNAMIVQKPGTVLSQTDLLIRNGLIADIGKNLKAPFDALVIDADSMYVYAGFIDAASHTGVKKKEQPQQRERIPNPGNPPNDKAGITPEISVLDHFDLSEKSVEEMRKNGFTIAHVLPQGSMLPGKGAVVSLGEGNYQNKIIKRNNSVFAQFNTERGVFPSTLIGVMSKWRDLYNNSKNAADYQSKYAANPAGLPRPVVDNATEALIPVVKKEIPVYFKTEKILDIHRVLNLKEELGFQLVLTNVSQIYPAVDRVSALKIPVLLNPDLPKEEEKKEEKKEGEEKEMKAIDEEKEALKARKQEAIETYKKQAGLLEKNNIPFAFAFIEGKAKDFKTNIRKMVESGLSENGALKAMTIGPAQLLGIDRQYGTVEKGKMAHLVITDKPYFDEKSQLKFVFVDGHKYEIESRPQRTKDANGEVANIAGEWAYEISIPGMTRTGKLQMEQNGSDVTVKMSSEEAPDSFLNIDNADLHGNSLVFTATVAFGGNSITLDYDLTFDGDTFEGNVGIGDFGSFPVKGSKLGSPKF
ncbi:MAG TPA: amidohydrolase family protein [Saprospiraceae bacterium]|nr:amidohydrolase family protein [Saprospiraceae bacterium]